MFEIYTLMDDLGSEHLNLCAKHGLSFFIQTSNLNIIFDCGSDETAIYNAKKMNVPIESADYIVCSHSHYDHSGGFPDFVQHGIKCTLYTGKEFFEPKYAFDGVKYTYLGAGFDEELLAKNQICHKECRDFIKLSDDCYVFGSFPRTYSCETIPKRFVKGNLLQPRMDDFSDEVCLAISTSKGLIIVVGCSHPGILNMLKTISERLKKPIYGVIGGTHLVEADSKRIDFTISEMKKMGVKILGLSHCSGEAVRHAIMEDKEVKGCHFAVGDCLAVE